MSHQAEKYVLAFDLSTSGAKAAIVSATGEVVATEFEPDTLTLLPGGGAEQDPALWWQRIKATSLRLIERRLVPVDDIMAISCTGQWSGAVALDRDGNPVANAMRPRVPRDCCVSLSTSRWSPDGHVRYK